MSNKTQLFCSKPFTWFEVSNQGADSASKGDVYMCCPSWLNTPIGNLVDQSVAEIWNGEQAQAIRRSILDGSFKYCDAAKCPFLQTVTGPVQPTTRVKDKKLKTAIKGKLTQLPYGPNAINCSYDRSCNLSCPSCRFNLIVETENEAQILKIEEKIRSDALQDATILYITGSGDPFGSPYFRKWLQTMKKAEMPHLQKIHLHSNAQLWTPKLWNTIPAEIRSLITSAEISIDAASSETYAMNRRGGDFKKLLQNLEFISSLRKHGLQSVTISMVVQENNFQEMADFVKLGQRFRFSVVYFSQLVNWGTFSDQEYTSRAIHLPTHPKHAQFLESLQNDIFDQPRVHLGNLTELRNSAMVQVKHSMIWQRARKLLSCVSLKSV